MKKSNWILFGSIFTIFAIFIVILLIVKITLKEHLTQKGVVLGNDENITKVINHNGIQSLYLKGNWVVDLGLRFVSTFQGKIHICKFSDLVNSVG